MRYANAGTVKENGVIFTPSEMATYLADEMIAAKEWPKKDVIRILDPAAGHGELLAAMITAVKRVFKAKIIVVGYETNLESCESTYMRISEQFPDVTVEIRNEDFLCAVENKSTELFDFVIANPPYVRTQILGSERAQEIAERLSLSGRIDIYYAFLVYTKEVLDENGIAGYITSNKFLTIKSGVAVRNYMLHNYSIHRITDLGDTKLFNASVLPCILIFSKGMTTDRCNVKFTSIYENPDGLSSKSTNSIFDVIHQEGCFEIPDGRKYLIQQGIIQSVEENALWNLLSDDIQDWLRKVESKTWLHFSDIGKIRVGIKTTADNVFIGDSWNGELSQIELLQPLITHRNAGQIKSNGAKLWKVLYTHTIINGKKRAVDIEQYPNAKKYLLQNYEQLSGRSYVKKANRNWFEIWVPQNPASWKHRKIVFRDISEKPQFWLDETGAIVNGDCYWIDVSPDISEDVIYLALAVANSSFIEKFYDVKFNTKLYSGKRRFMSQFVERFPIPYYDTDSARKSVEIVKKIIAGHDQMDVSSYKAELDYLVEDMFS